MKNLAQKIGPNLAKLGQILGQKNFLPKKSNKGVWMHEKSCQWIFLKFFLTLAKSPKLRFCKSVKNKHKNKLAWFFMHSYTFIWLFGEKNFLTQNLANFGQIWTNFLGQIFYPSTTKWDLPMWIDSQSLTFFCPSIQKLFNLVRSNIPRPIPLWPCGL